MKKTFDYMRSLFFAVRPFENFQHFLMGAAGFLFASYSANVFYIGQRTLFGALALFCFLSQVLSYNNYATFEKDLKDKEKRFEERFRGIEVSFLFWVSFAFFILTVIFSLLTGYIFALVFILLMLGWILYTHPVVMLKKGRFVPYILDMATMPFISVFGSFIALGFFSGEALLFSLFFGFIEIAGHINHITMDYEIDKNTGIKTLSVRIGPKKTFVISMVFFTIAALYFLVLSFLGLFPVYVGIAYIPGLMLQILLFWKVMAGGFDYSFSRKFRKIYRIVYFIESSYVAFIFVSGIKELIA